MQENHFPLSAFFTNFGEYPLNIHPWNSKNKIVYTNDWLCGNFNKWWILFNSCEINGNIAK